METTTIYAWDAAPRCRRHQVTVRPDGSLKHTAGYAGRIEEKFEGRWDSYKDVSYLYDRMSEKGCNAVATHRFARALKKVVAPEEAPHKRSSDGEDCFGYLLDGRCWYCHQGLSQPRGLAPDALCPQ